MAKSLEKELLEINQKLLDSITAGDWATYRQLCDPDLTAFEPEALGHLVQGLDFHRYYFERGGFHFEKGSMPSGPLTTMCTPVVRIFGDVGLICFVRLIQKNKPDGSVATVGYEETRIWHHREGKWIHVHFHRSPLGMTWNSEGA